MNGTAPQACNILGHKLLNALKHLTRGLIGKGEQKNVSRIHPLIEQVGDTVGQRACFSRSRTGNDECRTRLRAYRCILLLVELRGIVNT